MDISLSDNIIQCNYRAYSTPVFFIVATLITEVVFKQFMIHTAV